MFYERGVQAVGVEAVAARAEVTKKTLYDRFGSKSALVVAYLEARDQRWRNAVRSAMDGHRGAPRRQLLAVFDVLEEWVREGSDRGCAFARALTELPDEHPGRHVAHRQKAWLLTRLVEAADCADAADPLGLAEQLLVLHEGACTASLSGSVADAITTARNVAVVLVEAASRPTESSI